VIPRRSLSPDQRARSLSAMNNARRSIEILINRRCACTPAISTPARRRINQSNEWATAKSSIKTSICCLSPIQDRGILLRQLPVPNNHAVRTQQDGEIINRGLSLRWETTHISISLGNMPADERRQHARHNQCWKVRGRHHTWLTGRRRYSTGVE